MGVGVITLPPSGLSRKYDGAWPSGKAAVFGIAIPGSNPGAPAIFPSTSEFLDFAWLTTEILAHTVLIGDADQC